MEQQRINVPEHLVEECLLEYNQCGKNNYFFWRWAFITFPKMADKCVSFVPDALNGMHFLVSEYENFIPPWAKKGVHLIPEPVMDKLVPLLIAVEKDGFTCIERYRFWHAVYDLMPGLNKTKTLRVELTSRHALLIEEGDRGAVESVPADFDSSELEARERVRAQYENRLQGLFGSPNESSNNTENE